jgi:hypothetical protein
MQAEHEMHPHAKPESLATTGTTGNTPTEAATGTAAAIVHAAGVAQPRQGQGAPGRRPMGLFRSSGFYPKRSSASVSFAIPEQFCPSCLDDPPHP